ncbi:CopG family transcriptional regulator [Corynebacterium appendicis]|uniref:CopG family transcriptional regulator n=1 Tax=Corynebacterium appendicis TaxID=163202 RepID=UPI00223C3177|nr:CopG family transcriptional regulator [Corynebacterium appendicis]MCT1684459.1 CopG family transcriptional regulator [Corynebacterium appendicis]MDK8626180.1 CopG family transcriptional regulator [Corynebacterium appendicis]
MAMTLRLSAEEDRALVLLASAWGCSKQEAAKRAVVISAGRLLDDAAVASLAHDTVPGRAALQASIRRARPNETQ